MASYVKLNDGSWGVKGTNLREGATIQVAKRDGSTSTVHVGNVVWSGSGVTIARIANSGTHAPTRTHRTTGHVCDECGRRGAHFARDLSGIGGYACSTCDDGSLSFC